jgi:hypothetical protein
MHEIIRDVAEFGDYNKAKVRPRQACGTGTAVHHRLMLLER